MPRGMRLLRDPLVHFLAIAAALLAIATAIRPPEADERTIDVDRAALLEFIQFRSKAFEPSAAGALLDSMSAAERQALIDDFVREEVLYREAAALGLEQDDYVIKQRLIQKFEFAAEAAIGDEPPTSAEIELWYDMHKDDYATAPTATFSHVFFSANGRGAEAAAREAEEIATALNAANAPFEAAAGKGDRFPFGVNYVERSYDYVASQFGEDAADLVFNPEAPFGSWRAGLRSPYGAHAVFIRAVAPSRTPPLSEIKAQIAEDAARARREEMKRVLIEGAIERYDVVIDLENAPLADGPPGK